MNIDWNVKEYLKDFAFVPKYGEAVLDMIDAAPGTLAVDLGCGNGGLTGKLIERGYRVIGVDASVSMLALARERHGLQVRAALLFDRPTPQQTEDGVADWIRMFDKAPFAGVSEELQETIIREAVETLRPVLYHDGRWYVDCVRIRIKAVKEEK